MKAKTLLISLCLCLPSLAIGCGSSSPKAFAKRSAKLNCRSLKKCEEEAWKATNYDTVAECIDEATEEDRVEAFVDMCDDFDRKAARQCLRAARKYKRTCDEADADDDDVKACAEVCGSLVRSEELHVDPTDLASWHDLLDAALERSEAEYEDEDVDEPGDDQAPTSFAP